MEGMQFPLRLYGTFTHEYLMEQTGKVYNGIGSYNDSTFGVPMPHYTANLEAAAMRGNHSLIATVRFIPAMDLQVPNPATNGGTQSFPFTTVDLLYRYQMPWFKNSSVTAAVLNVTNQDPPIAGGALTTVFSDTYFILGRVFRVGAEFKF